MMPREEISFPSDPSLELVVSMGTIQCFENTEKLNCYTESNCERSDILRQTIDFTYHI